MKLTDTAKNLIDGKNFADLATVQADGSPHVAPVWIDHDGDVIIINTTKTRQKTKNVRKDPRVALSIFDITNPYNKVIIRGKVFEITEYGADEHIDKMSVKYTGRKYPYHDPKDPRVLMKMEITNISE